MLARILFVTAIALEIFALYIWESHDLSKSIAAYLVKPF